MAATAGEGEEVRRLLDGGASPDVPDEDGTTALYQACAAACWGHKGAVIALLDSGADPSRQEDVERSAMTALHWAASNEHLAVVRALLGGGADPGIADSAGRTALHHAAGRGAAAVVRTLLASGADPASPDGQGRRPIDLARQYAGRDIEAEVVARVTEHAPQGAQITVRRERSEGGDVRVVAEVRDHAGNLRSESWLCTGHTEIVRLLETRAGGLSKRRWPSAVGTARQ
ncbi:ankyrin repeat domain-containing protein [Nonomuraea sp. NPDC049400]|uniref:ankyrin repeat domain-containing protein n=1 Tax=Nonomuraea sp. NPDC049400 TaxID=3364352 RepID=UPI0037BC58FC